MNLRIDIWDYCYSLFWNMFETFINFKKEKQYMIIGEDLGSTKWYKEGSENHL